MSDRTKGGVLTVARRSRVVEKENAEVTLKSLPRRGVTTHVCHIPRDDNGLDVALT